MKFTALVGLLLTEAVLSEPSAEEKRQLSSVCSFLPGVVGCLCKQGDTAVMGSTGNPPGAGRQKNLKAKPTESESPLAALVPGAKRITVRTGPYTAPGMAKKNRESGLYGMLESYYDLDVEMPCTNCNILRQVGGLEYENGTNANIDTGLWLHHMVHMNYNPSGLRWDPVGVNGYVNGKTGAKCDGCVPMDGLNMATNTFVGTKGKLKGTSAKNTERFFVTGNERTPFNYFSPDQKDKPSAYHLDPADRFFYLVELMNMNDPDAKVYITMTYDVLPGALPAGWDAIKTVFLDANSCGSSELESPHDQKVFNIKSPAPWPANIEGRIVDSIGHLHDGGTHIDITASDGMLCNSTAAYATKPEYVYKSMGGMLMPTGDKVAVNHISIMDGCGTKDVVGKQMKLGQKWTTTGYYDYNKAVPNEVRHKETGKTAPGEVMAISIVLVAVKPGQYDKLQPAKVS